MEIRVEYTKTKQAASELKFVRDLTPRFRQYRAVWIGDAALLSNRINPEAGLSARGSTIHTYIAALLARRLHTTLGRFSVRKNFPRESPGDAK